MITSKVDFIEFRAQHPVDRGYYLVKTSIASSVCEAYWTGEKWLMNRPFNERPRGEVTHWAHMPKWVIA